MKDIYNMVMPMLFKSFFPCVWHTNQDHIDIERIAFTECKKHFSDFNSFPGCLTECIKSFAGFCAFYVVHGILRERVYEIYAFVAAILVVLMYCILEYSLFNPAGRSTVKLVSTGCFCFKQRTLPWNQRNTIYNYLMYFLIFCH